MSHYQPNEYFWTDGQDRTGQRARKPCPQCAARARQVQTLKQHRELAMIGGVALLALFVLHAMSG